MGNSSFRTLCISSIVAVAVAAQGQTLLSDFSTSVDGWSGTIVNNTPFINGSTTLSRVENNGDGALNITDGGFGGGAIRIYSGLTPEQNVVTIVADMRIVTDPGNLAADTAFGLKIDNGPGTNGNIAYSKSIGTTGNDSNQQFVRVAAAVVAGSDPVNVVAAVTPNKNTWSVGSGSWTMQLDNVHRSIGGTVQLISDHDTSAAGWSGINTTNSPFAAGSSTVSHVTDGSNGVVQVGDAGFTGGAVGQYSGAITTPGVHTVLADVRVVSEGGALTEARVAAAPGITTNAANLNWSATYTTAADDSGQAFTTVAVPVETTGASDLAIYALPNLSAGASGSNVGAWTIQVDNVRVITNQAVPVSLSGFSVE